MKHKFAFHVTAISVYVFDKAREFKLGKILRFEGSNVLYSDEFAKNEDFTKASKLIELSDIIIIGSPHTVYKDLTIPKDVKLVDLWGIIEQDL